MDLGTNPTAAPAGTITIEKSYQPTLSVQSLTTTTNNSNWIRLNFANQHFRKTGDWVVITGVTNEARYNGSFSVVNVDTAGLWMEVNVGFAVSASGQGNMWLDRRPNGFVGISVAGTGSQSHAPDTAYYSLLTTVSPHYRKPGDWVMVENVLVGGSAANVYNNYLLVTAVIDRFQFEVRLPSNTSNPGAATVVSNTGFITGFQAISANGGLGGGVFSNRIANCYRSGTYQDTWMERDAIVRRNYFYNVYQGLTMLFNAFGDNTNPVLPQRPITYAQNIDPVVDPAFAAGTIVSSTSTTITAELAAKVNPGFDAGIAMQIIQSGTYYNVLVIGVRWNIADPLNPKFQFDFEPPPESHRQERSQRISFFNTAESSLKITCWN